MGKITIKDNEKYYILSARHLIEDETDKIFLYENGMKVCDLRIVKSEEVNDLILFAPIDENIVPRYYVKLATIEPLTAEDVIVVWLKAKGIYDSAINDINSLKNYLVARNL